MATKAQRILQANAEVDRMPRELRACVHEYGYAIVNACLMCGVREPRRIHFLVHEIWAGARQPKQKTGSNHNGVVARLDWLLTQAGAEISAQRLLRFLQAANWAVVPMDPTSAMVAASLAEVSGGNVRCTKQEKHRRRIKAALIAGSIKPSVNLCAGNTA